MKKKITVEQNPDNEVPQKMMAQSIVNLGNAMQALSRSRLKRETVVVLIHHKTKIPMYQIELVMNNLEALEATWLK